MIIPVVMKRLGFVNEVCVPNTLTSSPSYSSNFYAVDLNAVLKLSN